MIVNRFGPKRPNEEVFVENSTYARHRLKERIVKEVMLPYICYECDLADEWNGQTLVLHIDHINGANTDHRIENLRFLCPNCHSQTDTFAGKKNATGR
jgi:Zn finger protein HypA/HybF involved in hydrogenase expression